MLTQVDDTFFDQNSRYRMKILGRVVLFAATLMIGSASAEDDVAPRHGPVKVIADARIAVAARRVAALRFQRLVGPVAGDHPRRAGAARAAAER